MFRSLFPILHAGASAGQLAEAMAVEGTVQGGED